MKPLIGINLDIEEPRDSAPQASVQVTYYQSIQKAGGIPILLPPMPDADLEEVINRLDGILFIGGLDYSPELYGEDPHETCRTLNPKREEFDQRLIAQSLTVPRLPILGICGGCQLLNIALGGSLIQDIPSHAPDSAVVHVSRNGWKEGFTRHAVKIERASKLGSIYGADRFDVPTSHHQAVKTLGDGLTAVAFADDDIVEAIEMQDRPFVIGVQWHPERDFPGNERLFSEFIRQSSSNNSDR